MGFYVLGFVAKRGSKRWKLEYVPIWCMRFESKVHAWRSTGSDWMESLDETEWMFSHDDFSWRRFLWRDLLRSIV